MKEGGKNIQEIYFVFKLLALFVGECVHEIGDKMEQKSFGLRTKWKNIKSKRMTTHASTHTENLQNSIGSMANKWCFHHVIRQVGDL